MATIEDIARIANVSPATVSRVLNRKSSVIPISEKTIQKVVSIAEELNYTPNAFAKALRTQKSNIIGVVVWDLTDPFFSDILRGIEEVLGNEGYNLLLSSAKESIDHERACYEKLMEVRAEGILVVGGPREFQHEEIIRKMNKPAVFVGSRVDYPEVSSVSVDNVLGGEMGARFLLEKLRSSFFFMSCTRPSTDLEDRWKGIILTLEQAGVIDQAHLVSVDAGEEQSYRAAKKFLHGAALPASVFAMNDFSALGVIRAVNDLGLNVPQDVAVLGFDDLSFSQYIEPRLSTIHQPRFSLGEHGAQLLVDLISGKELSEEDRHIVLAPKLVVRSSA